jgi:hypothetical protein
MAIHLDGGVEVGMVPRCSVAFGDGGPMLPKLRGENLRKASRARRTGKVDRALSNAFHLW